MSRISSCTWRYLICANVSPVFCHTYSSRGCARCFPLRRPLVTSRTCLLPTAPVSPGARSAFSRPTRRGTSHTGLVCTTSRNVRFIQVSHSTKWPLSVSPFLSSTSMGWPCAALRRPRGNCERPQSVNQLVGAKGWGIEDEPCFQVVMYRPAAGTEGGRSL